MSTRGVMKNDAVLFVAAKMPKRTPQTIEITRVMTIRETVLNVYEGRCLISGFPTRYAIR